MSKPMPDQSASHYWLRPVPSSRLHLYVGDAVVSACGGWFRPKVMFRHNVKTHCPKCEREQTRQ